MNSPGPREQTDSLTVTVTLSEGMVVVEVCGEVDLANHDRLRAWLASVDLRPASVVCIDLSRLTFCDVTGTGILLRFAQRTRAAGMIGASPSLSKVMGILAESPNYSPGLTGGGTRWKT